MGRVHLFEQEVRLKKIRKFLNRDEYWWLSKLSKSTGMSKSTLTRTLKNYFGDVIKTRQLGKTKLLELKHRRFGKKEKECYKKANILRRAISLRKKGFSYSEITKKIKEDFKIHLASSTLSAHLRNIPLTSYGKIRLKRKIRKDRQRAQRSSIKKQIESGTLERKQKHMILKAAEANTKKIPKSSSILTEEKVKIIGHCLFDGSVINSNSYRAVVYTSKQKRTS